MPTEKQQWLDKYNTYFFAATEYNRQHYGKRIKQLKRMLEDEKFLEFLSNKDCKEDIITILAKSECCSFDMYICIFRTRRTIYPRPRFRFNQSYEKNVESITIRKLYQKFISKTTSKKDM